MPVFVTVTCAFCTLRISDTSHRNAIKLCRIKIYLVKLCNVMLFFGFIWQNYVNFSYFDFRILFAPYLRHHSSQFSQTLQKKYQIVKLCNVDFFFDLSNTVKIMSFFYLNFYFCTSDTLYRNSIKFYRKKSICILQFCNMK